MGASVQFYGIDDVLTATENMKCPCWGIWINGRMFCKYESDDIHSSLDILRQNLEVLDRSGANTVYTLKFFECTPGKPVKVNDKSICDAGSFNFKLIEPEERNAGLMRVNGYSAEIVKLREEIAALKAANDDDDDDDDEPETLGSVMLDLLKNPSQMAQVVNVFRAALGQPVQNIAAIAGIPAAANTANAEQSNDTNAEERMQRTAIALDKLEKGDTQFMERLEKLAKMKSEHPEQYNLLLGML